MDDTVKCDKCGYTSDTDAGGDCPQYGDDWYCTGTMQPIPLVDLGPETLALVEIELAKKEARR